MVHVLPKSFIACGRLNRGPAVVPLDHGVDSQHDSCLRASPERSRLSATPPRGRPYSGHRSASRTTYLGFYTPFYSEKRSSKAFARILVLARDRSWHIVLGHYARYSRWSGACPAYSRQQVRRCTSSAISCLHADGPLHKTLSLPSIGLDLAFFRPQLTPRHLDPTPRCLGQQQVVRNVLLLATKTKPLLQQRCLQLQTRGLTACRPTKLCWSTQTQTS